eukprot:CAMPEP_0172787414 /NCGR_PEP_ID=MMETSP1074-20121228/206441_1 /TAXON_ID=2916 /ORGANISM="Ceratium fusus, Strain PA161109" /LENGTH=116 /DNA_ID=CAMNT_0013624439 /DNA_START=533 /DNA_END=884 /DNA_ORIENTATION=+
MTLQRSVRPSSFRTQRKPSGTSACKLSAGWVDPTSWSGGPTFADAAAAVAAALLELDPTSWSGGPTFADAAAAVALRCGSDSKVAMRHAILARSSSHCLASGPREASLSGNSAFSP